MFMTTAVYMFAFRTVFSDYVTAGSGYSSWCGAVKHISRTLLITTRCVIVMMSLTVDSLLQDKFLVVASQALSVSTLIVDNVRSINQSITLFRHTQTLFTEQCNQTKHSRVTGSTQGA